MDLDNVVMDLLRPAADHLRRVLQRMDADAVPAALRTLADSSARRMPPPLLRRALTELDRSEWLRAEVAAATELPPDSAVGLFVMRPDHWESRLADLTAQATADDQSRDRSVLERRLAEALDRIALLEESARDSENEVAVAERKVRDRLRNDIDTEKRARRQTEQRLRLEAREAARLAAQVERLEAERVSEASRADALRALLEKERRTPTPVSERPTRSWFPDDPMDMATELDRITAATRRRPLIETEIPLVSLSDSGRIPDGIRPDRVEVIRWLMNRSLHWLIDGYNVAHHLTGAPDAVTRDRLVASAGMLATLSAPGSTVVVVFDSSVDTSFMPADRRVRVVFAHSADEWIIEHAGRGGVVVSSDRRVREASELAGALGVWAEAFSAWIGSGGAG